LRLKLDENLGRHGQKLLADAGHDVATVSQQGLSSARDGDLIQVCKTEGRCLVTLDLGFANPMTFNPSTYVGIAVLRLPRRPGPRDIDRLVETLAGGLATQDIHGKLWIVEPGRVRIHQQGEEGTDG